MNEEHKQVVWKSRRSTLGRELAVIVPIVITVSMLKLLFDTVDGIISPLFHLIGLDIRGLGFATMIALILVVGVLSRNLVGMTLGRMFERLILSIPIAKNIYGTMKDLMQIGGKGKSFRQVVLVEYPRQGIWTIGFATNEITVQHAAATDEMVSIYIPNPPNPTSGMLVLIP